MASPFPDLATMIVIVYATNWPTTAKENSVLQIELLPANARSPASTEGPTGYQVATTGALVRVLIVERFLVNL